MPNLIQGDRVHSIVGAFYAVYNYYGSGFLETVYAGALEQELRARGHEVARELAIRIAYKGVHVAWQRLDMVIDGKVIVETSLDVGLLLHFASDPKFYRFVNSRRP